MANRRITELQEIAGTSLAENDLFTVVHVSEVDPTLKNRKLTVSGTKDYLDVYYFPRTGGTVSGAVIVQGNLTVSGSTTFSTATFTGAITVGSLIAQSGIVASGTISGATITGTNVQGTNVNGVLGNFDTITGYTISVNSGNFLNRVSGTTITGASGAFTSLTGTTTTGTTANFVSGVFTTQISGATITGTTVAATTGNYTSLTGATTTGTTANFVSGVFTTQVSGTTITGTTVSATTGTFTSLTGTTTTGTTANFVSGVFTTQISGTTITGTTVAATTGIFSSGLVTAPSIAIGSGTSNKPGVYSPGTDQLALVTSGVSRLQFTDAGAYGIGGANYGTSGQVITSNGISAAPSWQSPGGGTNISVGNTSATVTDTGTDGAFTVVTEGSTILVIDSNGFAAYTGAIGRGAPVTKTGSFTLGVAENWIITNSASVITVTLPAASLWTGREVSFKHISSFGGLISASSNVVPLAGGAAGTTIYSSGAGRHATLVSDGTNWVIMNAGSGS